MTFREIIKEKEFWFLCCLVVLMFPGAIFFGETFFYRDLYLHYLPQKKLLSEIWRSGDIPLWNPYLFGGQPFLAEINYSVLYPSNLFYVILPQHTAFNIDIIGHQIFGAVGAYCVARLTGLSGLSSFVCGMVFSFCGFSLSLVNLMNRMLAHPYIPWLCILWHRTLLTKSARSFLLCVVFCVFQILAGSPEWTLISFTLMLVWSLTYVYEITKARRILFLLLLGVCAVLVSAIQIIPTYQMAAVSSRAQTDSFESFSLWSLHFERLPEFILPHFLGRIDTLSADAHWGSHIEDLQFPYILSIYFGLGTFFLAAAGVRRRDSDFRKLQYSFAVVAVVALLFSLGRFFPLSRFLYEWIPGIGRFRYPMKFLAMVILPISYLAAAGFESQWNSLSWKPGRWILICLSSFLAGLFLLCWLVLFHHNFLKEFTVVFFKQTSSQILRSGLFESTFHALLAASALCSIYTLRRFRQSPWQKIVVLAVITVDLMIAGKSLNPLAPIAFYEETPDAANLVRKELRGGKLYRTANPDGIVLNAPSNDIIWQYRWNQEVLKDYLGATYKIPMIFHEEIDGLAQKRLTDLTNSLETIPWAKRLPLLSAASVTVIMTHEKLIFPGVELKYVLRNRSNKTFYIYVNHRAVLHAAIVSRIVLRKDFKETFELLTSETFSHQTEAVTEEKVMETECNTSGSVKLMVQSIDRLEYNVFAKCNAFFVASLPFYKDWKVYVDGSPQRLLRMNWAFSGLEVPSGSHKIKFLYSPRSVKIGAIISLVSTLLLLAWFTVKMKHAPGKA